MIGRDRTYGTNGTNKTNKIGMKLLVITQVVDKNDSDLGFFHRWIELLAARAERVLVVCLKEGSHALPANVTVLSLGKEKGASRWQYVKRFYKIIWSRRKEYNGVFVHMNPEYIILGGLLWRLWGKKILFWYTHKAVNLRLRLAEMLATKIFTPSKESFRLRSKKVEITGHGIDVQEFDRTSLRPPTSRREAAPGKLPQLRLLSVGRISPVKDLETVIKAVDELRKRGVMAELDIVGDTKMPQDEEYKKTLADLIVAAGLSNFIRMNGGVAYDKMGDIYRTHDLFVHTSRTGSIDKVVLEALAAGLTVFSSSEAFADLTEIVVPFAPNNFQELAAVIEKNLKSGSVEQENGRKYVQEGHDLGKLIERIVLFFDRTNGTV